MTRSTTLIAAAIVLTAAAAGAWWFFSGKEAPPLCPGESSYCDRAAYVEGAAAACAESLPARERTLIERTTTVGAYCDCMGGKMYGAFPPEALARLDTGTATTSERGLVQSQRETWAAACLKP